IPWREVLLQGGPQLHGWRTAQIPEAILSAFGLSSQAYSLTPLRYDLRKMKAHGLLERPGRPYCYRLTPKSIRVAALFILVPKRVCGPLATSLFHHRPDNKVKAPTKIETAYYQADHAIQKLIDLLAAREKSEIQILRTVGLVLCNLNYAHVEARAGI